MRGFYHGIPANPKRKLPHNRQLRFGLFRRDAKNDVANPAIALHIYLSARTKDETYRFVCCEQIPLWAGLKTLLKLLATNKPGLGALYSVLHPRKVFPLPAIQRGGIIWRAEATFSGVVNGSIRKHLAREWLR